MWVAPSRPNSHCFRSARIHETVAVSGFPSSRFRASRERIKFTLLYEVKESLTRKLLLHSLFALQVWSAAALPLAAKAQRAMATARDFIGSSRA